MPQRVVRELVTDHEREFVVALGEADHAGVDADVFAVRERVDVVVGHRDDAVVAGRERRDEDELLAALALDTEPDRTLPMRGHPREDLRRRA